MENADLERRAEEIKERERTSSFLTTAGYVLLGATAILAIGASKNIASQSPDYSTLGIDAGLITALGAGAGVSLSHGRRYDNTANELRRELAMDRQQMRAQEANAQTVNEIVDPIADALDHIEHQLAANRPPTLPDFGEPEAYL